MIPRWYNSADPTLIRAKLDESERSMKNMPFN